MPFNLDGASSSLVTGPMRSSEEQRSLGFLGLPRFGFGDGSGILSPARMSSSSKAPRDRTRATGRVLLFRGVALSGTGLAIFLAFGGLPRGRRAGVGLLCTSRAGRGADFEGVKGDFAALLGMAGSVWGVLSDGLDLVTVSAFAVGFLFRDERRGSSSSATPSASSSSGSSETRSESLALVRRPLGVRGV
jgi:hypothetical protein